MFRQTALLHIVEKPSLCRVPEEASIVSYSLCARQPSFRLLAFNIAYNIILDFILESNPLMQKLKKKFQLLEPSLKDEGHLRSTGDALLLKRLFALCAAQMITVMVNRRSEKRINIRRVWDYPNKQKSDVKGRVSLTDFSPVGTHRICLLISQNRIPRRFLREMSLHFTTDTKRAFVEYRISKKLKNHWISHVKATVSVTSISTGSISGAAHLLIAMRG